MVDRLRNINHLAAISITGLALFAVGCMPLVEANTDQCYLVGGPGEAAFTWGTDTQLVSDFDGLQVVQDPASVTGDASLVDCDYQPVGQTTGNIQ